MSSVTFKNLDHITDTCAICLREVTNEAAHKAGEAFHRFHAVCIGPWLIAQRTPTCPTCRREVTRINRDTLEFPGMSKANRVISLLVDAEAGKKVIAAARENNIEKVRELLTGCYIEQKDIVCALTHAASHGTIDVVRELLGYPWFGNTCPTASEMSWPVFEAAHRGHREILHLLLNDPRNNEHYTNRMKCCAALYAVEQGSIDVVSQLFAGREIPECDRTFILIKAAEKGQTEIVRLLLAGHTFILKALFTSALTKAAEKGHGDVVRLILSTGHPGIKGCLPIAINAASKNGQFKTAALLYSAALEFAGRDNNPEMSLVKAAYAGDLILVRENIMLEAEQEKLFFYRECALHWGGRKGAA